MAISHGRTAPFMRPTQRSISGARFELIVGAGLDFHGCENAHTVCRCAAVLDPQQKSMRANTRPDLANWSRFREMVLIKRLSEGAAANGHHLCALRAAS